MTGELLFDLSPDITGWVGILRSKENTLINAEAPLDHLESQRSGDSDCIGFRVLGVLIETG